MGRTGKSFVKTHISLLQTGDSAETLASQYGIELEVNQGLNLYEMELRLYDPAIARWNAIDPVTHHSFSTYSAFDNNPVFWADPSGADGEHYNWDTGRYEDDQGNEVSFETAMASQGLNSDGSEKPDQAKSQNPPCKYCIKVSSYN